MKSHETPLVLFLHMFIFAIIKLITMDLKRYFYIAVLYVIIKNKYRE